MVIAHVKMIRFLLIGILSLAWMPLHAAIVVTYREDTGLPNPFSIGGSTIQASPFDINGDGNTNFTFRNTGFYAALRSEGQNRFVGIMPVPIEAAGDIWYSDPQVIPLPEGRNIGPDASFPLEGNWHHHTDSAGPGSTGFVLGYPSSGLMQFSNAYIGVEFWIDNNIHYGWIHYVGFGVAHEYGLPSSMNTSGGWINTWAYNSIPGEGLHAGQVPEPATVALLSGLAVLFFAGVARWRRRRGVV